MSDERGGADGAGSSAQSSGGGPAGSSSVAGSSVGGGGSAVGGAFVAGGAAADFVSGLGRKAQELRAPLAALDAAVTASTDHHVVDSVRPREELRRRLHAIGTGARLFHFDALAQAVTAATRALDEVAVRADLPPVALLSRLVSDLTRLVDGLPQLAWHRGPAPAELLPSARPPLPPAPAHVLPWTVLVVGDESLALALEDDPGTFPCELERTTDLATVVDLARAFAPDLIVVDVDRPGALDALAALVDDSFAGPVPVVAVGRDLQIPRDGGSKPAARLVALGVSRALDKPFSPSTLREACADAVGERSVAIAAPLAAAVGVVTPETLADRIVAEVRRMLVDDLEPFSRDAAVDLGSGADVLGPVWGALARVRDVVAQASEGRVAFRGLRLERPVALDAPLAGSFDEGARRGPSRRTFDVDLEGRVVVVADDDGAVRRFLAASLRGAGATVVEAEDGDEALLRAREHGADLVVVDVVMPGRDGAAVARALHHDPALRDRPVILLSWKEDLLRRLRDLRASGAGSSGGSLRKGEDASVVVARAREALVSRVRIEARLAHGAEVRGRLDDLSPATLLELVQRLREEACVIVRDASSVWEVELDHGRLLRVSRTQENGTFARGRHLLPSLLGVVGGRFLVRGLARPSAPDPAADADVGELDAELARVLTRLRAATDLFAEHPARAARIELDLGLVAALSPATPPSLHGLLDHLVAGASPAALLVAGEAPPSLVESLLLDLARRGAIVGAWDASGADLLATATPSSVADDGPASGLGPDSDLSSLASDLSFASLVPPPLEAPEGRISQTPGSLTDAVLEVSEPGAARDLRPLIDPRGLQLRTRPGSAGTGGASPPSSSGKGTTLSGLGAARPAREPSDGEPER